MNPRTRIAAVVGLTVSFAVFVGMMVVLTGRLHAAALTAALAAGALGAALFIAGRPLVALRALTPRSAALACAGGLLAVFGAPALVAAVRLTDAPAGSVVVFWMTGGWAALGGVLVALTAVLRRSFGRSAWALVGAALAVAGAAGVVADWERPSSFSPLVRFPVQEVAILAAGALFIGGGMLLVRAGREGRTAGALLLGSLTGFGAASVWWIATGAVAGWASLGELPVQVTLAALAWGVVCVCLPLVLDDPGPAGVAGALAIAPLLLSALTLLEQAVGVAGPQPFVVPGVLAGSLVAIAGAFALAQAARRPEPATASRPVVVLVALVPAFLAVVALLLPAIIATADVRGIGGSFSGSWTLSGAESVAGWSALGLSLLVPAIVAARGSLGISLAGVCACVAWPWLTSVPTHVLTTWLAPGIEAYYGTEYGSITFAAVRNVPMLAAVAATGVTLAIAAAIALGSSTRHTTAQH